MFAVICLAVISLFAASEIHASRSTRARVDAGIVPQPPHEQPDREVLSYSVVR